MNTGKSLAIAIATKQIKKSEFAREMRITSQYVCYLLSKESWSASMLKRASDYFEMPVSDFIKLGE